MSGVAVLLAAPGLRGEPELVAACHRPGTGLTVVRRCVDLADLLGAATAGLAGVAVLGPRLPRLGRDGVARLRAAGVVVVGVVAAGDEQAARELHGLDVSPVAVVPPGDAPAAARILATVVGEAVARRPRTPPVGYTTPRSPGDTPAVGTHDISPDGDVGSDRTGAATDSGPVQRPGRRAGRGRPGPRNPVRAATGDPAAGSSEAGTSAVSTPPGRLVAVWGPTGAPGRTSVAIAIADEAARAGTSTLLVDADTYGGTVALALGMLDEASGLAVACRHSDGGTLDAASLAAAARALGPSLRVLTGITTSSRWPDLRPAALTELWRVATGVTPLTVVDTGFCLEQDEELSFDTIAPRRNAATVTALEAADEIVAVGTADPIGMARLVAALPDLAAIAPGTPVRVVVTRVRNGVLGRDPGAQVRRALERHAGMRSAVLVPEDRAAYDSCLREGQTLGEAAPRSPARAVLRALAADLLEVVAEPAA